MNIYLLTGDHNKNIFKKTNKFLKFILKCNQVYILPISKNNYLVNISIFMTHQQNTQQLYFFFKHF